MSSFAKYISDLDSWVPDLQEPILPNETLDGKAVAHGCCSPQALSDLLKSGELKRCPFCAYAVRKLAIARHAGFQAIWLKYCLSPDTGYIFAVLRPHGVEREEEVAELLQNSLVLDDGSLAQELTREGRRYYRQKIFEWFIRRYAWGYAWTGIRGAGVPLATKVNLLYPRLLGGIIIGFLPLVPESGVWKLAKEYAMTPDCCPVRTLILCGASLLLVFLYIFHECFKLTEESATAIRRAFGTLLIGSFYSVVSFGSIYWPLMYRLDEYAAPGTSFWTYAPFFCPTALLVGVFLQFFWEDKTITEPL